jgi:four helix bundle protein
LSIQLAFSFEPIAYSFFQKASYIYFYVNINPFFMKNFKNLLVWEKSHQLTLNVYKQTANFPSHELYGLVSQIRRSSVSIPSNIAEGSGRNSDPELARFLTIAHSSASELSYQLFLSFELGYFSIETYNNLESSVTEVLKMLNSFIQKLSK